MGKKEMIAMCIEELHKARLFLVADRTVVRKHYYPREAAPDL